MNKERKEHILDILKKYSVISNAMDDRVDVSISLSKNPPIIYNIPGLEKEFYGVPMRTVKLSTEILLTEYEYAEIVEEIKKINDKPKIYIEL